MKKIKDLLKRLETRLLENQKVFKNTTTFRNYLTKILVAKELFHLKREVEKTINSWGDNVASVNEKAIIRVIMDSVYSQTAADMSAEAGGKSSFSYKARVLINLTVAKDIVTQLSKIIGVQPMRCPVSQVFSMQYSEKEKNADGSSKLTLEVVAQAVEATTRKLQTGWTIEAMQDMKSMHGLDIEKELTALTGSEISQEIIGEVIADLLRLGEETDISKLKLLSTAFENTDNGDLLGIEIRKAAAAIAHKTHRGAGNYAIMPPLAVALLQTAKGSTFKADLSGSSDPFNGNYLSYCGDLGNIKIYVSAYIGDRILVGYAGQNSGVDAGYFFSPYIPALSSGVVINALTYQPCMNFITRYGKCLNKDVDTAKEYYRVIKLDSAE